MTENNENIINFPKKETRQCEKHGVYESRFAGCEQCKKEDEEQKEQCNLRRAQALEVKEKFHRLTLSQVPFRYREAVLNENNTTELLLSAYSKRFALKTINTQNSPSAILYGNSGAGKTYLASAMARIIILDRGYRVHFAESLKSMLEEIKTSYSNSEAKNMQFFMAIDLLIIDEFLASDLTPHEHSVLFDIINNRYNEKKPVIIATNRTPEDIKNFYERIFNKITEYGKSGRCIIERIIRDKK